MAACGWVGLRRGWRLAPLWAAVLMIAGAASSLHGDDARLVLTIDHYVRAASKVPSLGGQPTQLYLRERVTAGTALRGADLANRVVLFVHGAGTPAEVSFDVPYQDYSWMAFLARAGFDVFSVDMTGYGRSLRPNPMGDPCNLAPDRQEAFATAACGAGHGKALTTIATDWDDVGAAVEYIRTLRRVERVSLVAWSLGGPRSGGYALLHPEKVHRLVLLAPAYNRSTRPDPPAVVPAPGASFTTQSRAEFDANWVRQVGCPGQVDPHAADSVWAEMLASDPVGATWGTGVRRAPQTTGWGWGTAAVARTTTPTLIVQGVHDKQVLPDRARDLYTDLGAKQKVLVDLGCASHNAMWESNHRLLFQASLEWLTSGTVNGVSDGIVKMGY